MESNESDLPETDVKSQPVNPKREIAVGIACIIGSVIWISVCVFLLYVTWNGSQPSEQLGLRLSQNKTQFVDLAAIHSGANPMPNNVTEPAPPETKPVNTPTRSLFHIPNLIAIFLGIRLFIFGCSKFNGGTGKDEKL